MKLSHEEFVANARRAIGKLASDMLSGNIDYLEGAIEISALVQQAELQDNEIAKVFILISSETDSLPIGKYRKNWSQATLVKHEHEVQSATKWAKEVSANECKILSSKYGT